MELLDGIQFPATRHQYVALAVERGLVPRDEVNMHRLGSVFYAIVEDLQLLTVQFRLWREAQEAPALDAAALQQIQENAIYTGGVLGHWITDSSQPLHTTVHSDDWDARYSNPKNYQSKHIHGRFETVYVDRVITERQIAERLSALRLWDDWRAAAEAHIRRSFSHFEQVYELDRKGAFGSGNEPPEALAFTADRLADGTALLRDAWYSAWRASKQELLDTPVRTSVLRGNSLLDRLREVKQVETRQTSQGLQVVAIGSRRNEMDGRQWRCYVNGEVTKQAIDTPLPELAYVEWRFLAGAATGERGRSEGRR